MPPRFSWRGQPTLQWGRHGQLRVGDAEAPPRRDAEGQGGPTPAPDPTDRVSRGGSWGRGTPAGPQTQSGQSIHRCPVRGRTGKKATPTPTSIPTGTSTPALWRIVHLGRRKRGRVTVLPPLPRLCRGGRRSLRSRARGHTGRALGLAGDL